MSWTARSASSSAAAGLDPFTDPAPVRVLVRHVVADYSERSLNSALPLIGDPECVVRDVLDRAAGSGPCSATSTTRRSRFRSIHYLRKRGWRRQGYSGFRVGDSLSVARQNSLPSAIQVVAVKRDFDPHADIVGPRRPGNASFPKRALSCRDHYGSVERILSPYVALSRDPVVVPKGGGDCGNGGGYSLTYVPAGFIDANTATG
jgi:hypothetical protein